MKILLLGANGQVGYELAHTLPQIGECVTSARTGGHRPCDIGDASALSALFEDLQPQLIVNAAAYTAVDAAEKDIEAAYALNRDAPGQMARWCAKHNALLVHYSTDYVFDGNFRRPYREDDVTAPLGVYGASKLAGEQAIIEAECRHLIFRTSWVYGRHGNNFVKTICKLALERDELKIVDDQMGTPTSALILARLTTGVLSLPGNQHPRGVVHLSATGEPVSWFGFAAYFLAKLGAGRAALARIFPVPTSEYPTPAVRPRWSVLDNTLFERASGLDVPHWRRQMDESWPNLEP